MLETLCTFFQHRQKYKENQILHNSCKFGWNFSFSLAQENIRTLLKINDAWYLLYDVLPFCNGSRGKLLYMFPLLLVFTLGYLDTIITQMMD